MTEVPRTGTRPRVVVVGAGISGLIAAHHLLRRGAEVPVLEAAERVAVPWRRRHPQLRLNTHRLHSSLPGMRMPAYLCALPTPVLAPLLARLPNRLTDALVSAAAWLAYGDFARYGLPTPADGAASRLARDGTALALDRGFMGMLEAGRITVVPEVVRLSDRDAHLGDGTLLRPEVIIAATGYRPALEPVVGHLGVLDATGVPTRVGEDDGLYFVGFRPTLAGTFRDAEREARGLAALVVGGRQRPACAARNWAPLP